MNSEGKGGEQGGGAGGGEGGQISHRLLNDESLLKEGIY